MRKLVLRNGKIYVERGRFAQALYAEDGVIQAVGTEEEVLTAAGKQGWFREWTGWCRDH